MRVGAWRRSAVGMKSRRTARDPVYSAIHKLYVFLSFLCSVASIESSRDQRR